MDTGFGSGAVRTTIRRLRPLVPAPARRAVRRVRSELPHRLADWRADVQDRLSGREDRLPPAHLRRRVGLSSSRTEFRQVGELVASAVLEAYREVAPARAEAGDFGSWLDFGCGCGRVARPLRAAGIDDLRGVDVDRRQVGWLRRGWGGERFGVSPDRPPLAFDDGTFDVVLAVSVFSHFDSAAEEAWLAEMARILRPGGLLIASTHGPDLTVTRADLTSEQLAELEETGHLFAVGGGPFNEDSAFHTRSRQERTWGRHFALRAYRPKALGGFQDLSVWASHEHRVGQLTATVGGFDLAATQ